MVAYIVGVLLFASEQQCDAIVCAGDHQLAPFCSNAFRTTTAQAVNQNNDLGIREVFDSVDGSLQIALQSRRIVVQTLWHLFNVDDVIDVAGEVFDFLIKHGARDDGCTSSFIVCVRTLVH